MSKKTNLPSLAKVKKALYADWALRVKQRDGWKCLLCGCQDNLTAHHWYVSDHHAHAARYCVDNGATLCYACHIRRVHTRADWLSVSMLFDLVQEYASDRFLLNIQDLLKVDLTVPVLRLMWDEMRSRPVQTDGMAWSVNRKGFKTFLNVERPHQIAVVGNTIFVPEFGLHDVLVVTKTDKGYRYTLRQLEQ